MFSHPHFSFRENVCRQCFCSLLELNGKKMSDLPQVYWLFLLQPSQRTIYINTDGSQIIVWRTFYKSSGQEQWQHRWGMQGTQHLYPETKKTEIYCKCKPHDLILPPVEITWLPYWYDYRIGNSVLSDFGQAQRRSPSQATRASHLDGVFYFHLLRHKIQGTTVYCPIRRT
jgi:hypothetical protein